MKRFYLYFITPQDAENSKFVTFGQTRNLGRRWHAYRNTSPDPKIVGLVECETQDAMLRLERRIRREFKDVPHRDEWLYHTPEVKAFYRKYTNVDIEKHLSEAAEHHLERKRKDSKERYQNTPEFRQRKLEHNRERKFDPEYRKRKKERERQRRQDPEFRQRTREYN